MLQVAQTSHFYIDVSSLLRLYNGNKTCLNVGKFDKVDMVVLHIFKRRYSPTIDIVFAQYAVGYTDVGQRLLV